MYNLANIESPYKMRMEYDANNNAVYVGEATPGTAEGDLLWRIKKMTYDANNNALTVDWADSTRAFCKSWTDRATYTYG